MRKRICKPRIHSHCGQPLDAITLCEVIPSEHLMYTNKEYTEDVLPEDSPDLLIEYRCSHCFEKLTGVDYSYVIDRIKYVKGQVSQKGKEEEERFQAKAA